VYSGSKEVLILWSNSGHGQSGGYVHRKQVIRDTNWHILKFDMWNPTQGGTDWKDTTITQIRIDTPDVPVIDEKYQVGYIFVTNEDL
jgi:hypothetical protein